ncbi:MAG: DHHW family protein, partial [Evtepia sp.]
QERVQSDSMFFLDHLDDMDKYPVFLDGNHSMVAISNPQAEGGALLVVRDSYAHCFSTFLAEGYQTVYLVDLRYYRESLSEFMQTHHVDRMLYLYGVDNLMTDTNSVWLS